LFLRFARERFKRCFLVPNVSAVNVLLGSHGLKGPSLHCRAAFSLVAVAAPPPPFRPNGTVDIFTSIKRHKKCIQCHSYSINIRKAKGEVQNIKIQMVPSRARLKTREDHKNGLPLTRTSLQISEYHTLGGCELLYPKGTHLSIKQSSILWK
jgi:hypothetical protein